MLARRARDLFQQRGAETTVLYEPELEDGGLGHPEIIEVTEPDIQ
jgi:hypothetical protein